MKNPSVDDAFLEQNSAVSRKMKHFSSVKQSLSRHASFPVDERQIAHDDTPVRHSFCTTNASKNHSKNSHPSFHENNVRCNSHVRVNSHPVDFTEGDQYKKGERQNMGAKGRTLRNFSSTNSFDTVNERKYIARTGSTIRYACSKLEQKVGHLSSLFNTFFAGKSKFENAIKSIDDLSSFEALLSSKFNEVQNEYRLSRQRIQKYKRQIQNFKKAVKYQHLRDKIWEEEENRRSESSKAYLKSKYGGVSPVSASISKTHKRLSCELKDQGTTPFSLQSLKQRHQSCSTRFNHPSVSTCVIDDGGLVYPCEEYGLSACVVNENDVEIASSEDPCLDIPCKSSPCGVAKKKPSCLFDDINASHVKLLGVDDIHCFIEGILCCCECNNDFELFDCVSNEVNIESDHHLLEPQRNSFVELTDPDSSLNIFEWDESNSRMTINCFDSTSLNSHHCFSSSTDPSSVNIINESVRLLSEPAPPEVSSETTNIQNDPSGGAGVSTITNHPSSTSTSTSTSTTVQPSKPSFSFRDPRPSSFMASNINIDPSTSGIQPSSSSRPSSGNSAVGISSSVSNSAPSSSSRPSSGPSIFGSSVSKGKSYFAGKSVFSKPFSLSSLSSQAKQPEFNDKPTSVPPSTPRPSFASKRVVIQDEVSYVCDDPDGELDATKPLPPFDTFDSVVSFFENFMNVLHQLAKDAEKPCQDLTRVRELSKFVTSIANRIIDEHDDGEQYKAYLDEIVTGAANRLRYAVKSQSHANLLYSRQNQSHNEWRIQSHLLSFEDSTSGSSFNPVSVSNVAANNHAVRPSTSDSVKSSSPNVGGEVQASAGAGGGGGDDSSSSSSSDDDSSTGGDSVNSTTFKSKSSKLTTNSKKKSKSQKEDASYRSIINCLSKNCKNFAIKSLSIHPDPTIRRERFRTWVTDVSNILSTHRRTTGVLDDYPANVKKITRVATDRAVKALLFAVTVGQAKEIVSSATSAYDALVDLKRNFAPSSITDKHIERQRMFNLRQNFDEKASDFLKRVRKQKFVAASCGCTDFDDEEILANIVLQGMNSNNKLYAAPLAELRATLVRNPALITFTYLEETFFGIDNSTDSRRGGTSFQSRPHNKFKKREHAAVAKSSSSKSSSKPVKCFHCGKPGHTKRECPALKNNKKSTSSSQVICHFCRKPGHYANNCPEKSKQKGSASHDKKVTFESAHIASEKEEHAAVTCEIPFNPSDLGGGSHDGDSSTVASSLPDYAMDIDNVSTSDSINELFGEEDSSSESEEGNANEIVHQIASADSSQPSPSHQHIDQQSTFSHSLVFYPNGPPDAQGMSEEEIEAFANECDAASSEAMPANDSVVISEVKIEDVELDYPIGSTLLPPSKDDDDVNEESALMAVTPNNFNTPPISVSMGDFVLWLLDSGATSHFTPVFADLVNPVQLNPPVYIRVADGSRLSATHQGMVELNFQSDEGVYTTLKLLRVLYVPGLHTRLFSIESFVSSGHFRAIYSKNSVCLEFNDAIHMTIDLPHVPPSTYVTREMSFIPDNTGHGLSSTINTRPTLNIGSYNPTSHDLEPEEFVSMAMESTEDDVQCAGGEDAPSWSPINWNDDKLRKKKKRMNVELGHYIFGHRAVSSLLTASKFDVWDDVTMVSTGDSWCDSCKVAVAPKSNLSKLPMRINEAPLKMIFLDCVPSPGVMRGVPGCNYKHFLFLSDPVSKYSECLGVRDKSAEETIEVLGNWQKQMVKKGFEMLMFIRADAGTNFTSDAFKSWCVNNNITLSLAGPKHQEQNAFAERAYGTASRMARSMLVRAHLPISFYQLALKYACKQMRVLPAKGLVDENGHPTTTYAVLHGKRPRIGRFKVFGCPCVFKRYTPQADGKLTTDFKQLNQGSRGIFVGFPEDQAGWLIFVPEKINNSHLVVSMDVAFDQHFISGVSGLSHEFDGSQTIRNVGTTGGNYGNITEATGDISNLVDAPISNWGPTSTFETDGVASNPLILPSASVSDPNIEDDPDTSDDDDTIVGEFDKDLDHSQYGRTSIDGVRRSRRTLNNSQGALFSLIDESVNMMIEECSMVFDVLAFAADLEDIDIAPYLPEPRNLKQLLQCPLPIKLAWIKVVKKELKFIIENETFRRGEVPASDDEVIPSIIIFKAKITSKGFLDKLKARLVARGDFQSPSLPEDTWAPCVFGRTFKVFVCRAVQVNRPIKQLDFIGAFCQGSMQTRLFITLPPEYANIVPEYAEYFNVPLLLQKSIYGLDVAHKVFADDLHEWLETNTEMPFIHSEVDPSLYIYRGSDVNTFLYLICYVDDCLYFGSDDEIESQFANVLKKKFNLELQGHAHWFLGTRLYRERDGSYFVDQETYAKHVLNRYCHKDSPWGLPPMKSTPAPVDYVYSKSNRPVDEAEEKLIALKYPNLSMASAVSSLLYIALNSRSDILWIVNKLAKSSSKPGLKDYEALMHCFGYLRQYPSFGIKYYANVKESPVYKICERNNVPYTDLIGFSDSSWQDCPDTGRSTGGYKIFYHGGIIDANSCMPVPVALSSAEAEYMSCCNLGAMICHLRELLYEFDFLGTDEYKIDGIFGDTPTLMLIDNQATVKMSKNYKVTAKNRHIARRWHFVRRGVKANLFKLHWIPAEDQLADDMTKTQPSSVSFPHVLRTLLEVPDRVRGYKSNTVGNR